MRYIFITFAVIKNNLYSKDKKKKLWKTKVLKEQKQNRIY